MSEGELVDILAGEYEEGAGCEPMLLFWYVQPGERVLEGQELCEVESAKAVVVIPAPVEGTLAEIVVREGEAVGSAQVLGRIRRRGDS